MHFLARGLFGIGVLFFDVVGAIDLAVETLLALSAFEHERFPFDEWCCESGQEYIIVAGWGQPKYSRAGLLAVTGKRTLTSPFVQERHAVPHQPQGEQDESPARHAADQQPDPAAQVFRIHHHPKEYGRAEEDSQQGCQ
jgi:hypothetical protein